MRNRQHAGLTSTCAVAGSTGWARPSNSSPAIAGFTPRASVLLTRCRRWNSISARTAPAHRSNRSGRDAGTDLLHLSRRRLAPWVCRPALVRWSDAGILLRVPPVLPARRSPEGHGRTFETDCLYPFVFLPVANSKDCTESTGTPSKPANRV